ncbi:MAG: hypothetical protein WBD20_27970 [Pirellulaceae bacterium]
MKALINQFSIVLLTALFAASSAAQDTPLATATTRTLKFPADQRVGVVELFASSNLEEQRDEEPELVPAFGSVQVATNQFASLKVGGVEDLQFLDRLPATGLQQIEVRGLSIDRKAVGHLTRFGGLQELSLNECRIDDDAFDDAPKLDKLQRLNVSTEDKVKRHLNSMATWISRLPLLDFLYAKPALDAIAIGKVKGHSSLKTITIDVQKDREAIIFKMISELPAITGLIVSVDEDVSPRALDRLASVPNLELLTLVRAKVDGELLKNIGRIGTVRSLRFLVITPGEGFLEGLKSIPSIENLTLQTMPWENAEAEREFQKNLPLTLLDLPNIKDLPDMRNLDAITLRRIFDMPNIESLRISGLAKGVDVEILSGLQKLTRLKTLGLSLVPLDDDDLQMLDGLENLEYLSLDNTKITGIGFAYLKDLPKLGRMTIMMNTRQAKPNLRGLASLKNLNRIQVFGYGFEPKDFYPIADCRSLRHVVLSEGTIDDSVAARFSRMPNLRSLNWFDSTISDHGASDLAKLSQLQSLSVAGDITAEGVKEFVKLPNLTSIFIRSSKLSEADKQELPRFFPAVSRIGFRDQ